jgi:hypothetical protein
MMRSFLVTLFLLTLSISAFGQGGPVVYPQSGMGQSAMGYFWTVDDTTGGISRVDSIIQNRTFKTTTSDTTQAFYVGDYKTIYLALAVAETCTIYIYYATSVDGVNFIALTLKDSIQHQLGGYLVKSLDMTSTIGAAPFVRFRFTVSQLAFAIGTTGPKYWARYLFKRF